jgi:dTDP-glucose 4,6-dehydratase/UDP-glucuronate decarboxylase
VQILKHDITQAMPGAADFDFIIHAASIASPTFYRQHPIETMDANVQGLRNLLEYSRSRLRTDRPVRGFLFFSSSEIYGDPPADRIPTAETYWGHVSCTGPRACYDESKRFGETLSVTFARQYGLPVTIARPFNNYGPGLRLSDRRVLPDFARDVLAGRNITLLSDGRATRTFCYVADAVAGYYQVLLRGRAGEAYNIGTEQPEVTMSDLAALVTELSRDLFGYKGTIVFGTSSDRDYLTHNPARRCPSIAKARRELGYDPRIVLDEGLRRLLLWYTTHEHAN